MIEKPDMALPTARATAAEPEVSSLRGGIANAGPEVSELLNVHLKDATDFHADWTAEGLALSPEEKAAELNRVFRHLAIPENDIAARLRGEAMMLEDTAHCRLNTFDCKTMTKIAPTRREEVLAKSEQNLAALLKRAADLCTGNVRRIAMNDKTLLPCPFCGGEAEIGEIEGGIGALFYASCKDDDCCGYHIDPWVKYARRIEAATAWNTRTTSLAAQEVDSGMSGDAVERAEWFWTNLPTGRKWTGLATNEKALVCHQIARITPSPAAQDGLVEALRDALAAAYVAGATDVHNAWVEGVNGGEPDFGEAGWDYAHSIALSAIKEQHHD